MLYIWIISAVLQDPLPLLAQLWIGLWCKNFFLILHSFSASQRFARVVLLYQIAWDTTFKILTLNTGSHCLAEFDYFILSLLTWYASCFPSRELRIACVGFSDSPLDVQLEGSGRVNFNRTASYSEETGPWMALKLKYCQVLVECWQIREIYFHHCWQNLVPWHHATCNSRWQHFKGSCTFSSEQMKQRPLGTAKTRVSCTSFLNDLICQLWLI